MNRARRSLIASSILAVLLVGTAGPAFAGDTGGPLRSPVGSWRTSTAGVKQTITFDKDGKVFGDSGCNRFTGGYTVKGDRITIGPLASTMMACPQPQMDAEASFLFKLQAAVSYTATKKVLKIFTPKDLMRFVKN
jgi:heat shock protein HslJ